MYQECDNDDLRVSQPLQHHLHAHQQLCRFQCEECQVSKKREKSFPTCCSGAGGRLVKDGHFVIHQVPEICLKVLFTKIQATPFGNLDQT